MAVVLKHKAQLYRQLHQGLKSGLPIERLLMTEILPRAFAEHGRRLTRNVQEGKPLSTALRSAGIIQLWEQQLLAIGEDSGRLDAVLGDLALFFETRARQLASLKAKLVYPGLILLTAIFVSPLPEVTRGSLSPAAYLFEGGVKVLVLYLLYKLLIVRPFEQATSAAFNPWLIRGMRWMDDQHWFRLMYEASYLNLLTLCLESGLDAAATLKLMRDGSADVEYRTQHAQAIQMVERDGMSLAQALAAVRIIRNTQVFAFLNTNEQAGTLHSEMRLFLMKKQAETAANMRHFMKTLGIWMYITVIGLLLLGFV
jgi:type II secretory pathway component PulF